MLSFAQHLCKALSGFKKRAQSLYEADLNERAYTPLVLPCSNRQLALAPVMFAEKPFRDTEVVDSHPHHECP